MPDVAKFLDFTPDRIVKTLIYDTEKGLVAVVVRGDREVNEVKLKNALDVQHLELASEEKVLQATGSPVGFAGPVGLAEGVTLIADRSAAELVNFVCGANRGDTHLTGVNWGRDAEAVRVEDLLLVSGGDACPRCDGTLELFRGIETGHVFKLGTKYSEAMSCNFTDEHGDDHPMIMGCYGLGIGRTVAAAIEQNHDKEGIIWPRPLAPFEVLLVALNPDDPEVQRAAEELYATLSEQGRRPALRRPRRAARREVQGRRPDRLPGAGGGRRPLAGRRHGGAVAAPRPAEADGSRRRGGGEGDGVAGRDGLTAGAWHAA